MTVTHRLGSALTRLPPWVRATAGEVGGLLRGLGEGAVLWAAFATAAAAVLAQLGRFNRTLDAISHFAPILLAFALAAAASSFLIRRPMRRRALVLAMVGAIGFATQMAPELFSALTMQHAPASGEVIKIVQFNAWGLENHDPAGSARWILAQNPDFVLAEESDDLSPVLTAALRAQFPYEVNCATSHCPDMILSRRAPLDGHGFNPLPFAWGRYPGRVRPFDIVDVHTNWPLPVATQVAHFDALARITAPLPHGSLIVGGDFNSTPWSFALKRLDRTLGLVRRTRALASWPAGRFIRLAAAPFPVLPIDHVYAGRDWRTVSVRRGPVLGSDHYPVVVVLARNP